MKPWRFGLVWQPPKQLLAYGPLATAGTVEEAANSGDAVVLSIPLIAVKDLPTGLLRGKVVLDTSNYYPFRDGRVADLDAGTVTTSELVARWLDGARYVKAFGNILAHHIPLLSRSSGSPDRSAFPIASNDTQAKSEAVAIIELLGFDTVDAGTLSETWKFEPEAAGYTRIYLADQSTPNDQLLFSIPSPTPAVQVKSALDSSTRVNVAERAF